MITTLGGIRTSEYNVPGLFRALHVVCVYAPPHAAVECEPEDKCMKKGQDH